VSRCQKTLRGEGHSAAGWVIGGSDIAVDCGVQIRLFGQWAAANCAAPPNASAGQYATLNCKPQQFGFACKWWYINDFIYLLTYLLTNLKQKAVE